MGPLPARIVYNSGYKHGYKSACIYAYRGVRRKPCGRWRQGLSCKVDKSSLTNVRIIIVSIERKILANTDEPTTGDYAYQFYNHTHPINGNEATIAYARGQLRGLGGKDVTLKIRGMRIDDDGTERRFTATRTFQLKSYSDVFGPGSAFGSVLHAVRERHSDEELVIFSLTFETVS